MRGERLIPLAGAVAALLVAAHVMHPPAGPVLARASLGRLGAVLFGFGFVWLMFIAIPAWWRRRHGKPPAETTEGWWLVGALIAAAALTGALRGELRLPRPGGVDWLDLSLAVIGVAGGLAGFLLVRLLRR